MSLDTKNPDFKDKLAELLGKEVDDKTVESYKTMINEGEEAGIPVHRQSLNADDFFPEKSWDVLAISGYMRPDPYSGASGVEKLEEDLFRVTVRLASRHGDKRITFTMRMMEDMKESHLVFNPLLNRFMAGEDYATRPVKISDSGRIRNELQTLCSEALEFIGDEKIHIYFNRIPTEVIPLKNQKRLLEILKWYKKHHPIWFSWLEIKESQNI